MVKKIVFLGLAGAGILLGAPVGCDKAKNPIIPANSAVLKLVIPAKILNAKPGSSAKARVSRNALPDAGQGALEFYLTADGQAPVTGAVLFASGSQVGNLDIDLPKAGKWLVSAEWFYAFNASAGLVKNRSKLALPGGLTAIPEFVGADEVDVQGTTAFTLNMEDIGFQEYSCYQANITDATNCDYLLSSVWEDFYSFDSGIASASVSAGTTGDLQAMFDPNTLTTYLSSLTPVSAGPVTGPSIFTYLGNGDLVNFSLIPSGAVYFPTTLQAKTATVGAAAAPLAIGDIFAVKVPATNGTAWIQITTDSNDCTLPPSSSLLSFVFVYNNEGLNYMKFDQTTNGLANCNLN